MIFLSGQRARGHVSSMLSGFALIFALNQRRRRVNTPRRSVTTSKTLSDFIKPFIERVKSGMQAFVVKVKYIANYQHPKKPVVLLQVAKNLLGRATDEVDESRHGTHMNQLPTRAAHSNHWTRAVTGPPACQRVFGESISHRPRRDGCA